MVELSPLGILSSFNYSLQNIPSQIGFWTLNYHKFVISEQCLWMAIMARDMALNKYNVLMH